MTSTGTRLLSLPEAAQRLGLSTKTLRAWVWTRRIDYCKIGRSVRIADDTVNRLIERGRIPALEGRQ